MLKLFLLVPTLQRGNAIAQKLQLPVGYDANSLFG